MIGDLNKEAGHTLIGVVVPGDGVDHLDAVHECWKRLLDGLWCSIVQWLDEFLKSLKVLDVILSFIECLSDSELNASPLGSGQVDLVSWLGELFRWLLRCLSEHIINSSAVLAPELLRDARKLSHALLPVVKLLLGSSILLFLLVVVVGVVEGFLDELTPLVEDLLEIGDHLRIWLLLAVPCISLPFFWEVLESDIRLQALECLFELTGELLEYRVELSLLLLFADTPS